MGLPRSNLLKPKSPGIASLAPAPAALEEGPVSISRESFRTKADSVEIEMAPGPLASPPHPRGPLPSAPSANELVERAAAMGAMRMTWESIVLPTDPILDEKRQPHVAERRARLTRVVKVALGACLGLCVLALGASAISSGTDPSAKAVGSAEIGKSVPSQGVVPIEKMDGTKHAKAHRAATVATTAAVIRTKRR